MTMKLAILAAASGLLLASLLTLSSRSSASGTSLGIDVVSSGSADLGPIDTCREVTIGQTFDVDVWVQDVVELRGWELAVTFDGARLTVTQHDAQVFRSGFEESDPVPNNTGTHFIGVAAAGGQSSGAGVLARITFQATANGLVELGFASGVQQPKLNPGTDPIPITGGLQGAHVAIGVPCGSVTPPVTHVPTPSPTPTPVPTAPPSPPVTPTTPPTGPTPSPVPAPLFDDPDCSGTYDERDALRIMAGIAGIPDNLPGCPDIGATVVGGAVFADVTCDGDVGPEDAVRLLSYRAGLESNPTAC